MSESPLRQTIAAAMVEHDKTMDDLTVMSAQTDPFRLDTPANHRVGEWLAETASTLGWDAPEPLATSARSFAEQTRRLIDSKAYRSTVDGGG